MTAAAHKLEVPSAARHYHVFVGRGLLGHLGDLLRHEATAKPGSRCAVITDSHVAPLYAAPVLTSLRAAGFDPMLI